MNRMPTASGERFREPRGGHLKVLATETSDDVLLKLAQSDPRRAAARMYDRFADDVNRVIFRLVGPDSEHDDLVQETFLRVLRHLDQVREAEKLNSWVVSVAVNVVLTELKRRKLRRWLSAENVKTLAPAHAGADHDSREALRAIFDVLDAMPATERTFFALRHLDDRTIPEIAELSRVSEPTVKRSIAKAERRFEVLATRMYPELAGRWMQSPGGYEP